MDKTPIEEILNKVEKKKISFDIDNRNLKMVDELAKMLKISRAKVLNILLIVGTDAYTNIALIEWEHIKKNNMKGLVHKEKKGEIKELMRKIKQFKKKWSLNEISKYKKK